MIFQTVITNEQTKGTVPNGYAPRSKYALVFHYLL